MPRKLISILGILVGVASIVVLRASGVGIALVATPLIGALIWRFGRCSHPGSLGLLPPVVLSGGARLPSRWFCADCGKSWPAAFDHERPPVVKYSGYDQSKAPIAARRAADLEKKRQVLAVQRSGLGMARAVLPHATKAPVTTVVSIQQGRRLAAK